MGRCFDKSIIGLQGAELVKHRGIVVELVRDQVNHQAFPRNFAGGAQEPGDQDGMAVTLEHLRPDVPNAGLILQGGEDDAGGRAGALPDQDQASEPDWAVLRQGG